jgi:hypothetical protein
MRAMDSRVAPAMAAMNEGVRYHDRASANGTVDASATASS